MHDKTPFDVSRYGQAEWPEPPHHARGGSQPPEGNQRAEQHQGHQIQLDGLVRSVAIAPVDQNCQGYQGQGQDVEILVQWNTSLEIRMVVFYHNWGINRFKL